MKNRPTLSLNSFNSVSASTSLILVVMSSSSSFCTSADLPSQARSSFFGVAMMSETTLDCTGGVGASCLCSCRYSIDRKVIHNYDTRRKLIDSWRNFLSCSIRKTHHEVLHLLNRRSYLFNNTEYN